MIKAGPCGISCTICRFNIDELCQCRIVEGTGPSGTTARSLCPVLQCATAHKVTFCARDCSNFPCLQLERTIPFRWSLLGNQNSAGSLPGWRPDPPKDASPETETLRVFCLGQFRVFRGSVELQDHHWSCGKGPTQKIKALFAFLLFRKAQGARKDTITDLLWSQQTDPERATSSFHQALFCLRRALEPDLGAGSVSSYIQWQGDRYYFAPQNPCWIDTDAFISYTNQAQALEQCGDSTAAVVYWDKALDLYRNEFLTGIDTKYTRSEFYDWCTPRCFHFEQLFLTAKMALARHHLALKQYDFAMEHAREVLWVEPAFEQAHRLLIRCLMEIGQPDNALGQYRLCETELASHQDRAPSHRTHLLYQELVNSLLSGKIF